MRLASQILVLMVIDQGGFYPDPHQLWHRAFVYMVISKDLWYSQMLPSVWQWRCHVSTCLNYLGLSQAGDRTQISSMRDRRYLNWATFLRTYTSLHLYLTISNDVLPLFKKLHVWNLLMTSYDDPETFILIHWQFLSA